MFGSERSQAVAGAGAIALLAGPAVLPGRVQLAAGRWPRGVDPTAHLDAHDAFQLAAMRFAPVGAAQGNAVCIPRYDDFGRHRAAVAGIGLGPVEGNAKRGAASTATAARMGHEGIHGGRRRRNSSPQPTPAVTIQARRRPCVAPARPA